jgi:hypothetical protein
MPKVIITLEVEPDENVSNLQRTLEHWLADMADISNDAEDIHTGRDLGSFSYASESINVTIV